jgi:hypothetical protein
VAKGGKRQGAGRPRWRVKVEDCTRLDLRHFAGVEPDSTFCAWGVAGLHTTAFFSIASTVCGFGGYRHWFVCPACESRAGTLFVHDQRLACRRCHGLAYRSQSSNAMQTAMARMFKHMHPLTPDFTRPKGMHWQTYMRLLEQAHTVMLPVWEMVQQHSEDVERQMQALGIDKSQLRNVA